MAKKFGRLLKCISRVFRKFLRKKLINVIFTIIISFGTFNEFSRFWQKNSQVCWSSNLSVQRKKRQIKLLNNWFFGFWQEKPVFLQENFWQGCQKNFRRVQRNTYRSNFPNGSLENSRIFEKFLKLSGQWWKNFSRVGKTAIDVRGNILWKSFSKEKNSLFFSDCERMFTSSEKFRQSCETRNLCIRGSFWGKTIFEKYIIFHTFFGLWSQKKLSRKEKFFPGCHNFNPLVQRHFLRKSTFFKKSFICSSVLEFEQFFLSIDKKYSGCQRNNLLIQKKVGRKKLWKNCIFKWFLDFEQKNLNN